MALPSGLATNFPAEPAPAEAGAAVDPDTLIMLENGAGAGTFVLLCDHASNRVPDEYQSFGFAAGQLGLHIAWDPGALGLRAFYLESSMRLCSGLISLASLSTATARSMRLA